MYKNITIIENSYQSPLQSEEFCDRLSTVDIPKGQLLHSTCASLSW